MISLSRWQINTSDIQKLTFKKRLRVTISRASRKLSVFSPAEADPLLLNSSCSVCPFFDKSPILLGHRQVHCMQAWNCAVPDAAVHVCSPSPPMTIGEETRESLAGWLAWCMQRQEGRKDKDRREICIWTLWTEKNVQFYQIIRCVLEKCPCWCMAVISAWGMEEGALGVQG